MEMVLEAALAEYRHLALMAHSEIVNPITGERLDIMSQCVNLRMSPAASSEARSGCSKGLSDEAAYEEVVRPIGLMLETQSRVWVAKCSDGVKCQEATIVRVNCEDKQYIEPSFDVNYSVKKGKKEKQVILKDVARQRLATRPLLVVGEPAAGKTTFSKQLLTYCARKRDWLVPVLARCVELHGYEDHDDMIEAFCRRSFDGSDSWFDEARRRGRLLVILDGYDEVGVLKEQLDRQIKSCYLDRYSLVVTSRETAWDATVFGRFQRVDLSRLDAEQRRAIVLRRLDAEPAAALLKEMSMNAALARMSENPLLLDVTISAWKHASGASLSRGRIYAVALDSMLTYGARLDVSPEQLRLALRQIAWRVHSRRIRDFDRTLVLEAVAGGARCVFSADAWDELELSVKHGQQFPLLAWVADGRRDRFRFSHLTFQEFLAAEYCVLRIVEGDHEFVREWVGSVAQEPQELVDSAWWQQVIEMCCDLLDSRDNYPLGDLFLSRRDAVSLVEVGDKSAACVAALLARATLPAACCISRGSLGGDGVAKLARGLKSLPNLTKLDLSQNSIGPDGCDGLAAVCAASPNLRVLDLSKNKLVRGELVDDSYAAMFDQDARSMVVSTRRRSLDSFFKADSSGLRKLLEVLPQSIAVLDVRSNSLDFESGCLLFDYVQQARPTLETVCGLPIKFITHHSLVQFKADGDRPEANNSVFGEEEETSSNDSHGNEEKDDGDTEEEEGRMGSGREIAEGLPDLVQVTTAEVHELLMAAEPAVEDRVDLYLETGGAALLAKLLCAYPQPKLVSLRLVDQRLPSDAERAPELFGLFGEAALKAPRLKELDLSEWWDAGLAAGLALGERCAQHPALETVRLGLRGVINVRELRLERPRVLSGKAGIFKNVGTGLLKACLPDSVTEIDMGSCGLGADALVELSKTDGLAKINGVVLDALVSPVDGEPELLRASAGTKIQTSDESLMVLSRLRSLEKETRERLTELDLRDCNMSSKSHVHQTFPFIGTTGDCDAGCKLSFRNNTDRLYRCDACDYDECSSCHFSPCPMVFLAETLRELPNLRSLNISQNQWHGKIGRSKRDKLGYELLGESLAASSITDLDLSRNQDSGPGFAILVSKVADMPNLELVRLPQHTSGGRTETIRFKEDWLEATEISPASSCSHAELLLLAHALRRNSSLVLLDLSSQINVTTSVAKVLRSTLPPSLKKIKVCASPSHRAPVLELDFARPDAVDLNAPRYTRVESVAPLFELLLDRVAPAATSIDFRNLDFGDRTEDIASRAARWLDDDTGMRGNRVYNAHLVKPPMPRDGLNDMALDLASQAIMTHGVLVLAEHLSARLTRLDLSGTGLSGRASETLFARLLEHRKLRTLDVSRNPFFGLVGLAACADFLTRDKALRSLCMQRVNLTMQDSEEFGAFALAIANNTSLVELDLRSNSIPRSFEVAVRRGVEKRPTVQCPLDVKLAFLSCNDRIALPTPSHGAGDATIAEIDDADQHIIPKIFAYLGEHRTFKLDSHLVSMMQVDPPAALELVEEEIDNVTEADLDALLEPRPHWGMPPSTEDAARLATRGARRHRIGADQDDDAPPAEHHTDDDDEGADAPLESLPTQRHMRETSLWARILFMTNSEQLVNRLVVEHDRLDAAATKPELVIRALRQPKYYGLALRMLRDWGAPVSIEVRHALLAKRNALWFRILMYEGATSLADHLCDRDDALKRAAGSQALLLATFSAHATRRWRQAIKVLDRGAAVTPAVRDLLLRRLDVESGSDDLDFDKASNLRGAVVLESDHPYRAASLDDRYPVSIPGATRLCVKFHPRSRTLDRYAYVSILPDDAAAVVLGGPYCRDSFAGVGNSPPLCVNGDSLVVRFCTDGDQDSLNPLYGWKLVVYALRVAPSATLWSTLFANADCQPLVNRLADADPDLRAAKIAFRCLTDASMQQDRPPPSKPALF